MAAERIIRTRYAALLEEVYEMFGVGTSRMDVLKNSAKAALDGGEMERASHITSELARIARIRDGFGRLNLGNRQDVAEFIEEHGLAIQTGRAEEGTQTSLMADLPEVASGAASRKKDGGVFVEQASMNGVWNLIRLDRSGQFHYPTLDAVFLSIIRPEVLDDLKRRYGEGTEEYGRAMKELRTRASNNILPERTRLRTVLSNMDVEGDRQTVAELINKHLKSIPGRRAAQGSDFYKYIVRHYGSLSVAEFVGVLYRTDEPVDNIERIARNLGADAEFLTVAINACELRGVPQHVISESNLRKALDRTRSISDGDARLTSIADILEGIAIEKRDRELSGLRPSRLDPTAEMLLAGRFCDRSFLEAMSEYFHADVYDLAKRLNLNVDARGMDGHLDSLVRDRLTKRRRDGKSETLTNEERDILANTVSVLFRRFRSSSGFKGWFPSNIPSDRPAFKLLVALAQEARRVNPEQNTYSDLFKMLFPEGSGVLDRTDSLIEYRRK